MRWNARTAPATLTPLARLTPRSLSPTLLACFARMLAFAPPRLRLDVAFAPTLLWSHGLLRGVASLQYKTHAVSLMLQMKSHKDLLYHSY